MIHKLDFKALVRVTRFSPEVINDDAAVMLSLPLLRKFQSYSREVKNRVVGAIEEARYDFFFIIRKKLKQIISIN